MKQPIALPDMLHLRREGTSVVVDLRTDYGPVIVHWGKELHATDEPALRSILTMLRPQHVTGGLDIPPRLALVPTASSGWPGTPGIEGHRANGRSFSLLLTLVDVNQNDSAARLTLEDAETEVLVHVDLEIGAGGVFTQRIAITNVGDTDYQVQTLQATFPVPWESTELLDTTGRHLRERTPQRHAFTFGTHQRESRRGRPGADATLILACGPPGFGFESGQVHGVHVGWSGNHRTSAERVTTGEAFLTGGELYLPGEVTLTPGETLASPTIYASWGNGLDELAHRFHTLWRARPHHPRRPRPITLNTWEAVYFDQDLGRLATLADAASDVGVERFVLDDGWFRGRRDDTSGLGDWDVDATIWPHGLHPLIDHVRARGMEFGLWVEPEMVNLDSDLARAHPDWILRARTTLPASGRNQQLINLANPDASAYIYARLHGLLTEYPIAYLKWDHNRDLVDPGSGAGGSPRLHAHTLAFYRLLDRLRIDHPELEIESCASGGARIDLGVLDRTDRVWVSDNLDPLERLMNQRYTGLLVPPEMLGTHITSPTVHTTGRTVDLSFSASTALIGHLGIEWDLSATDAATRQRIAEWITFAKEIRPLVRNGRLINADNADPSIDVRGVVGTDGREAVFVISQIAMSSTYPTARVRLPGLDAATAYRIETPFAADARGTVLSGRSWVNQTLTATGEELGHLGLRPLVLHPQQSLILRAVADQRRPRDQADAFASPM